MISIQFFFCFCFYFIKVSNVKHFDFVVARCDSENLYQHKQEKAKYQFKSKRQKKKIRVLTLLTSPWGENCTAGRPLRRIRPWHALLTNNENVFWFRVYYWFHSSANYLLRSHNLTLSSNAPDFFWHIFFDKKKKWKIK